MNRLLEASTQGVASMNQGGYWNPGGIANGGTYANGPAKFDVTNDLLTVVSDMRKRNVPLFSSPYGPVAHCLADPVFLKHLRANSDFREVAKYPGAVPVEAIAPGAMPMSAPLMPSPMGIMGGANPMPTGNPNALLFGSAGYGQTGFMSGDVLPKNKVVAFSRKAVAA